jgi:hypothetical protein
MAMCGDAEEGMELAVGTPCPHANGVPETERPRPEELDNSPVTPDELAEFERQERERDTRIGATAAMKLAWAYSREARDWLARYTESPGVPPDDIFKEAVAVAEHDAFFITVKIRRALRGRDQYREDNEGDDPVQNDWNGSAKVALISIERSAAAWQTIASATGEPQPAMLSQLLTDLRFEIETAFPAARSFIRPGFDESGW